MLTNARVRKLGQFEINKMKAVKHLLGLPIYALWISPLWNFHNLSSSRFVVEWIDILIHHGIFPMCEAWCWPQSVRLLSSRGLDAAKSLCCFDLSSTYFLLFWQQHFTFLLENHPSGSQSTWFTKNWPHSSRLYLWRRPRLGQSAYLNLLATVTNLEMGTCPCHSLHGELIVEFLPKLRGENKTTFRYHFWTDRI